jgi:heme oxygenase (mycobilin-producing)
VGSDDSGAVWTRAREVGLRAVVSSQTSAKRSTVPAAACSPRPVAKPAVRSLRPGDGNNLYTTRDVEKVAPGAEFPILTSARHAPSATVDKRGGKFDITDEARDRNDILAFTNHVQQVENTIVRELNQLPAVVRHDRWMIIIKVNAIRVPRESGDELAHRFAARAGALDDADGFQGYELLKPTDDRDQWLVITRWRKEESFRAWLGSESFTASAVNEHRRQPANAWPSWSTTEVAEFGRTSGPLYR